MNDAQRYFSEIFIYHYANLTYKEKYARYYLLLDRLCKDLVKGYATSYTNLFGRLYAICKQTHYKNTRIEIFRIHAKQIQKDVFSPTKEDYLYDLKALCEAISHFTNTIIAPNLARILPNHWRNLPETTFYNKGAKRIRMIVERWDDEFLWGFDEEHPSSEALQVKYNHKELFTDIKNLLQIGMQINLLSVNMDKDGILYPELIVLHPDFLIDISALSACFMNYGNTPLTYLFNKFRLTENTEYILLGNAANQFLDDCVNEEEDDPVTYEKSIKKAFKNDLLNYCTCPHIDGTYFKEAKRQFDGMKWKIKEIVEAPDFKMNRKKAMLEPSFICESLGLQGRMDFLQSDFCYLIELKSGKAETFNGPLRPKTSHEIQVALYKEILYYTMNMPRNNVTASIYYSKYNQIFGERCSKKQIQEAIRLRNLIVCMEVRLKNGEGQELIESLTPEDFNVNHDSGKLWTNYQYPPIACFLNTFHGMTDLEKAYFYSFLTFIECEQFLSKTGDDRPDSSHGFADVWDADLATKQNNGNILIDMKIHSYTREDGIKEIHFTLPDYDENFLPNFRKGDIVLFYERNKPTDNATNKQVFRCNVESVDNKQLTLLLRNHQRNENIFPPESLYAVEHDYMEASYTALYKGLFSFLTTDTRRKSLLLGLEQPRVDTSLQLTGDYHNEQINEVVLQAKQAKDYFLLVGPPGSGKTSVALKALVEEFTTEKSYNLLLLSYTNRAVDEICEMLETIQPQPAYIRIGSSLSCEKQYEEHLLQRFGESFNSRKEIVEAIRDIHIFVGTTTSVSSKPELFQLKHFHAAIVDEASQILEPQLLGLICATPSSLGTGQTEACAINKFIFIGDTKQLPAVVLQNEGSTTVHLQTLQQIGLTDCRNSLFERLYMLNKMNPQKGIIATLNRQGRMHPSVGDFANRTFYKGVLEPVPVPHQIAPLEFPIFDKNDPYEKIVASHRTFFVETPIPSPESPNKVNQPEALEVAQYVQAIYHLCVKNGLPFNPEKRIGIIVPFRNQIAMIQKEMKVLKIPEYEKITVDTVERYQGSQRDIILYSTTISQLYQLDILSTPILTDGVLVDRKMNVAITRAKKQLLVFGESVILSRQPLYKELIKSFTKDNS